MQEVRKVARSIAFLAGLLALAGCTGWSDEAPPRGNFVIEPWSLSAVQAAAPANPNGFDQSLASDYSSYATALDGNLHDWADADYFSRKGLAAANGQVVSPENNANWLIPLEVPDKYRTMLSEARQRLVGALDKGGRQRLPAVAARAQVSYDCWVERMEDDWWQAVNGDCRKQFEAALAQLEGPPPVPQAPAAQQPAPPPAAVEYRIYFEFDKADLTPEAQQIVTRIAEQEKAQPNTRVELVGKADLTGTDAYNMRLSQRRADTVQEALVKAGVPADHISARWVGLREPPVPTPKGVREPRNRVVEVTLH